MLAQAGRDRLRCRLYDVGLFYFTPALINIDLYEHLESNDDWSGDPWKLIASTDPGQHKLQWAGKRLGGTNVEVGCRNELTLK